MKIKDFPIQFFVKPHLVQFSRTLIVLFLNLIKQILFLHYCFTASQFAHRCKAFIWKLIHYARFVNIILLCYFNKILNQIFLPKRTFITVAYKDLLIVLPFLGQFFLNLRSRLHITVLTKHYPNLTLQLFFSLNIIQSTYFNFKTALPKNFVPALITIF